MERLICFFLLFVVATTAGRLLNEEPIFGEFNEHSVSSEEIIRQSRFEPATDIKLCLYTRKNPTNPNIIVNGNENSLGTFDKQKDVKIVMHGWNSNLDHDINGDVTAAFLKALDVNVIFVDWSVGGTGLYGTAVENVPKTAGFVAKLVDWLVDLGVPLTSFHVMGHSLGAHAAGIAGRSIKHGKVPYITGFDPANPLFDANSNRIRPSDAEYVEIIHSNSGELGLVDPVGHNDFYPNEGTYQPGCLINFACSHSRSYKFFADSLDHTGFMANQCKSVGEAMSNTCSKLSKLHMGGAKPKPAVGVFHLLTNSKSPYWKG